MTGGARTGGAEIGGGGIRVDETVGAGTGGAGTGGAEIVRAAASRNARRAVEESISDVPLKNTGNSCTGMSLKNSVRRDTYAIHVCRIYAARWTNLLI